MSIRQLEVSGVRNFRALSISPVPAFNWIVGANGAGKTSLLEAVSVLSTTKSFRTHLPRHYIHHEMSECVVFGRVDSSAVYGTGSEEIGVGVRRRASGPPECKVNGVPFSKLSELAKLFPVVVLQPDSIEIIEGDPSSRREFLDWTMFHVEHSTAEPYLEVHRHYSRVLEQRNRLLKEMIRVAGRGTSQRRSTGVGSLEAWNSQLTRWAIELDARRKEFVRKHFSRFDLRLLFPDRPDANALTGSCAVPDDEVKRDDVSLDAGSISSLHCSSSVELNAGSFNSGHAGAGQLLHHESLDPQSVDIEYIQGWPEGISFADALQAAMSKDIERGSTSVGPHRADIRIMSAGLPVREHFSRGQKKHLVAMMKLKQVELFASSHVGSNVIFLGDDVFSELDVRHAAHLFHHLRKLGVQCFVTTIEAPENKGFFDPLHDRMFHVEHGELLLQSPPPQTEPEPART